MKSVILRAIRDASIWNWIGKKLDKIEKISVYCLFFWIVIPVVFFTWLGNNESFVDTMIEIWRQ